MKRRAFVGIDPGMGGGMAAYLADGKEVHHTRMTNDPKDIVIWLGQWDILVALVEEQTPRPTYFRGTSSILKSTCLLYGNYRMVCGILAAKCVPVDNVPPKRWQKFLGFRPKNKGESDTSWKNYLKTQAERIFPGEKVTLAVSDALLLAYYCRLKWGKE